MLSKASKMTREGQVIIPAENRAALDFHEGDYFLVEEMNVRIVLRRPIDIARETSGIFKQYRNAAPVDPEQERAAFERAIAEEVAASMRDE